MKLNDMGLEVEIQKINTINKWSPVVKSLHIKNQSIIDFISIYCELYCSTDNPNDLGLKLTEINNKFSIIARKKIIGEYYNSSIESIEYEFEDGTFSSDPIKISLLDLRDIFGEFAEQILKIYDLESYREELISDIIYTN